jgi:hypothetical protein
VEPVRAAVDLIDMTTTNSAVDCLFGPDHRGAKANCGDLTIRLQLSGHAADVAMTGVGRARAADSASNASILETAARREPCSHTEDEVMDYLRRLQTERPLLFWAVMAVAFWLAFQVVLFVAALLLGPFGLPPWVPLVVVVGVLVVIARRQQRSR